MFGNYLLTLYRSLSRHRLFAALNILGLAVGIAVFLVLWLFVQFQTGFERWIPDAGRIYVVRETWNLPGLPKIPSVSTMGGLIDVLRADYPQLLGTRLDSQPVIVRQGAANTSETVDFVDPTFFRVFDLPLAAGDKAGAIRDTSSLVISQKMAAKYFGTASPIGRTLVVSVSGVAHTYRVTAVLKDLPANTDLKIDMLALLVPQWIDLNGHFDHWGSSSLQTYLKFPSTGEADALGADLERFVDRHASKDFGMKPPPHTFYRLDIAPLPAVHLSLPSDAATVATLGLVGLLTLLIAALNYVNLATARASLRAREVALRKVLGGSRQGLIVQFLTEAVVTSVLAGLIGLALAELALPLVNAAGGTALHLGYLGDDSVFAPLALATVGIGLGAGAYPALVLSQFQPAAVLASARTPGGGRMGARVREGLVVVQFAIAVAFIVCTSVLLVQTRYLETADLGFHRDGLILVPSMRAIELSPAQRASMIEAFHGLPGVSAVTQSDTAPGDDGNSNSDQIGRLGQRNSQTHLTYIYTGEDYFTTYGAHLIAGRLLDRAHGLDDRTGRTADHLNAQGPNVVLNAQSLHYLGFPSPQSALGQQLEEPVGGGLWRRYTIVGVIGDVRFHSPREPVRPLIYFLQSRNVGNPIAAVRFTGTDPRLVTDRMQAAWRRIAPGVPFEAKTVAQNLSDYYRPDQQRSRLFTIGAVLAVLIGCVGLYGLASFNTARRVKEIGIRKTLGASTSDVLKLLVGQFLRPVLIANLIAWPLAWLAMRNWLSGFDQRIELGPQYFVAATVLTLLIAVGTVLGQALSVARAEPAKALRHE